MLMPTRTRSARPPHSPRPHHHTPAPVPLRATSPAAAAALLLVLLSPSPTLAQAVFVPITGMTEIRDITPDGNTVVGTFLDGTGRAARWDRGLGAHLLAGFPDQSASYAWGVTADGQTVVGATVIAGDIAGQRATRWSKGSPEVLPGGSNSDGITPDGQTIVGGNLAGGQQVALRWNAGGAASVLPSLPDGRVPFFAIAASDDGRVIAGAAPGIDGFWEACAWIDDVAIPLGTLPHEVPTTYSWNVSPDGSTIIGFGLSPTGISGWRWTLDTGMQALPSFSNLAHANALNVDGSIIVGDDGGIATIWTEATGTLDLKAWLESEHDLDLSGWTLTEAGAITPDGLHIAGRGSGPNGATAWIVTIPAPGAAAAATLLALLAPGRRRRPSRQTPLTPPPPPTR